eukprot:TRINITY_DN388_c1_g1_i1.p1 TRINITY_DN388_c1_g1~~TRINITY_DN388_c1_g1_i1.p1  ORF type:complete len:1028 (-),score=249.99 TRINITY_DN388_c1_g1_i1:19-2733(-)
MIYLVFKSGEVAVCGNKFTILSSSTKSTGAGIVFWCKTIEYRNSELLVVLRKIRGAFSFDIYRAQSSSTSSTISYVCSHALDLQDPSQIICCSLNSAGNFSLFREPQVLEFFSSEDLLIPNSLKVQMRYTFDIFPDSQLKLCFLNDDQLALLGPSKNVQEEDDGTSSSSAAAAAAATTTDSDLESQYTIQLWDAKHGVMHSDKVINLKSTKSERDIGGGSSNANIKDNNNTKKSMRKKGGGSSIISPNGVVSLLCNSEGNYLFSALRQSVVVLPIRKRPAPTLLQALGKLESVVPSAGKSHGILSRTDMKQFDGTRSTNVFFNFQHLTIQHLPKSEMGYEVKEDVQNLFKIQLYAQTREAEFVETLTNPTKTPTLESFNEVFIEYAKHYFSVGAIEHESVFTLIGKPFISTESAIKISHRCVNEQYWNVLNVLVKCRIINFVVYPPLLDNLIEHKQLEVLVNTIFLSAYFYPSQYFTLFKYFVFQVNPKLLLNVIKKITGIHYVPKRFEEDPHFWLLSIIFQRNIDPHLLIGQMKSLSPTHVMYLLEFFISWIELRLIKPKSQLRELRGYKPDVKFLLGFTMCLVEAQFATLIMYDGFQNLLQYLKNIVSFESRLSHATAELSGTLHHLKERRLFLTSSGGDPINEKNLPRPKGYPIQSVLWISLEKGLANSDKDLKPPIKENLKPKKRKNLSRTNSKSNVKKDHNGSSSSTSSTSTSTSSTSTSTSSTVEDKTKSEETQEGGDNKKDDNNNNNNDNNNQNDNEENKNKNDHNNSNNNKDNNRNRSRRNSSNNNNDRNRSRRNSMNNNSDRNRSRNNNNNNNDRERNRSRRNSMNNNDNDRNRSRNNNDNNNNNNRNRSRRNSMNNNDYDRNRSRKNSMDNNKNNNNNNEARHRRSRSNSGNKQ